MIKSRITLFKNLHNRTGADEDEIYEDPETLGELQVSSENAKKSLTQRDKTRIPVVQGGDRVAIELTREKFEELSNDLLERTIILTNEMLDEAKKKDFHSFDDIIVVGGSSRMPQVALALQKEFRMEPKMYDPDEAVAKGAALWGFQTSIQDELKKKVADKIGKKILNQSL